MEKISLKDVATGKNFSFTGRRIVAQFLPLGKSNKFGRVEVCETAHNQLGRHDPVKPAFVLAYEEERGMFRIEQFRDGWQIMKFLQNVYTDSNHPLKPHCLELARQAAANCQDLNEWYGSQIVAFMKKRRIARERIEVEKEQIAIGEREREAEKLAEERAVEERIQAEIEARSEGFLSKPNLERLGIY